MKIKRIVEGLREHFGLGDDAEISISSQFEAWGEESITGSIRCPYLTEIDPGCCFEIDGATVLIEDISVERISAGSPTTMRVNYRVINRRNWSDQQCDPLADIENARRVIMDSMKMPALPIGVVKEINKDGTDMVEIGTPITYGREHKITQNPEGRSIAGAGYAFTWHPPKKVDPKGTIDDNAVDAGGSCRCCKMLGKGTRTLPHTTGHLIHLAKIDCPHCGWNTDRCYAGAQRGLKPCNGLLVPTYQSDPSQPEQWHCQNCGAGYRAVGEADQHGVVRKELIVPRGEDDCTIEKVLTDATISFVRDDEPLIGSVAVCSTSGQILAALHYNENTMRYEGTAIADGNVGHGVLVGSGGAVRVTCDDWQPHVAVGDCLKMTISQ